MDPFHHHHHHSNEDEEDRSRYPRPGHQPPPLGHQPYDSEYGRPAYPPTHQEAPTGYNPYPPTVQHVSHEPGYSHERPPEPYGGRYGGHYGGEGEAEGRHHFGSHHGVEHSSSGVQHVGHEGYGAGAGTNQQTYRIYCRAEENYSLSIRDGKVVLARNDPNDEFQHWIKDMRYSTRVKDAEGFPAFSLINKVTGEAIKHSLGQSHPVKLINYNPNDLDESVLWAESKDVGHGFRCIRMVNNIHLNFDAFNGDKDHGGVKDGTIIVLWEWAKGDNQRWKIVPH